MEDDGGGAECVVDEGGADNGGGENVVRGEDEVAAGVVDESWDEVRGRERRACGGVGGVFSGEAEGEAVEGFRYAAGCHVTVEKFLDFGETGLLLQKGNLMHSASFLI